MVDAELVMKQLRSECHLIPLTVISQPEMLGLRLGQFHRLLTDTIDGDKHNRRILLVSIFSDIHFRDTREVHILVLLPQSNAYLVKLWRADSIEKLLDVALFRIDRK